MKTCDSRSLLDLLVSIASRIENRLRIALKGLSEAYELREEDETIWIPSGKNLADGLTKKGTCDALDEPMKVGHVDVDSKAEVKRNKGYLK